MIYTSNQRVLPWLGPALFLDGANHLPDDGQFVCVDDFGLSAAVDELQRPVPLALSFTHHRSAGVLLHLCADPEHTHLHHHLHPSETSQLHLISESTTLPPDLWTLPPYRGLVWNVTLAEYPVLAQLMVTFPPSSTHGTVRMDRAYALGNVNTYSSPWSRRYSTPEEHRAKP